MLAIRLMQLFSENGGDFTKIAGILGLYFQIRDDYINLMSKDVITIVFFNFISVCQIIIFSTCSTKAIVRI